MTFRQIGLVSLILALTPAIEAAELEGDHLYKVSTVRAATGSLANLLAWIADVKESDYYEDAGVPEPLIMRHSQGDHWDLMIITSMDSWTSYYDEDATDRRQAANEKHAQLIAGAKALIAFDEDNFAYGPSYELIAAAYADNDFYHIEMFAAAPGKAEDLFEQRRMENAYLAATGQTENMIFRRAAGSDVDVFTIGFHNSLEAFAAPASASNLDKEKAARDAGFKNLADLSFYLRSLLSGHHDTLAVKVR